MQCKLTLLSSANPGAAFIFLTEVTPEDCTFYGCAKTVFTVYIKVCLVFELLKYTVLSDIKVGQKYLQNLAICKNTGAPLFFIY